MGFLRLWFSEALETLVKHWDRFLGINLEINQTLKFRELTICIFNKLNLHNTNFKNMTIALLFCSTSQFKTLNVYPSTCTNWMDHGFSLHGIDAEFEMGSSDLIYLNSYLCGRDKEVWDSFLSHHKRHLKITHIELNCLSCWAYQ